MTSVGDEIQIIGITGDVIYTTVEGLEVEHALTGEASEGSYVGVLLGEEITRECVDKGYVINPKINRDKIKK